MIEPRQGVIHRVFPWVTPRHGPAGLPMSSPALHGQPQRPTGRAPLPFYESIRPLAHKGRAQAAINNIAFATQAFNQRWTQAGSAASAGCRQSFSPPATRLAAFPMRKRHFQRRAPFKQGRHLSDLPKHMFPKKPDTFRASKIPVVEQPQSQVVPVLGRAKAHQ
jgi:hypothetical protein